MAAAERIHATAIVIGEAGVLIRGASGTGKSTLALALIALTRQSGGFARLVADDRVALSREGGRLLARPVAPLAGLVERRGLGLTPEPHLDVAVIRLVIDCLGAEPERLPEPEQLVTVLLGLTIPRLAVHGRPADAALALAGLGLLVPAS